jgi:hypothetical protein
MTDPEAKRRIPTPIPRLISAVKPQSSNKESLQ